ncbi:MAG TPA: hypothetical protein VGR28_00335 [Candidatus Thermoplasmatota archaeon]|jgi:hypothetical protein|nr:hypothetical protein [Candidatus Thermoplasmatota archaeon]
MVKLAYGPDVPGAVIDIVEFHARNLGLPLHLLEMMGSNLDRAEQFVLAAERGLGMAFAMTACYGQPFDALLEPQMAHVATESHLGIDP